MRLTRVFVEARLAPGGEVQLSGSAAAHLTRVLRLSPGDALTLFDGHGGEYRAELAALGAGRVTVRVGAHQPTERESPLPITLAQGVARGERMDLVVQKATELGVAALQPLLTARSVVRLSTAQAERKLAHWRAVAIAACEQCGRNRLPQLAPAGTLETFLAAERARPPQHARLLLSPQGGATLRELSPPHSVSVLIGPEGGLTPAEQQQALAAGFRAVRLGPRVLRTETAALTVLALLQQTFGDL